MNHSVSRRRFLKISSAAAGIAAVGTKCIMPGIRPVFASVVPSGGAATDWLHAAKFGVFNQGQMAEFQQPAITTVAAWNAAVNAFDVDAVANQLQRMGARYLIHGLGQNSGFYCAPNATYDSIVGESPSPCSTRDLVSDLYAALNPRGIVLMVYLPAAAAGGDSHAENALGWQGYSAGTRQTTFLNNWQRVMQDWSNRWGNKVAGWWFDGMFTPYPESMYNYANAPNWDTFAAAARSGNSSSILAFNPKVQVPIQASAPQEDYTAGETDHPLQIFCNSRWVTAPANATEAANAQIQFHCMTYAGSFWGQGSSPNYTTPQLVSATNAVTNGGGAITWDMPVSNPSGTILPSFEAPFTIVADQLFGRQIANDTDPSISYVGGGWFYSPNRGVGNYGDDVHATTVNGDHATWSFNGSGFQILSERGGDMGNVAIYIDGNLMLTYNCYLNGAKRTQQVIYQTTGLASGSHTVTMVKVDGQYMVFDAYRILSTSFSVINNTDSNINYVGSGWGQDSNRNVTDVNQDVQYTTHNGDYFTYTFVGTGIQYITENDADMGNVEILLDGISQQTVNCYTSGGKLTQQPMYTVLNLTAGRHTIKVRKVDGTYAILDALRVFV